MCKLKKWKNKAYLNTDAKWNIFLKKNKERLYADGRKNYKQGLKDIAAEE